MPFGIGQDTVKYQDFKDMCSEMEKVFYRGRYIWKGGGGFLGGMDILYSDISKLDIL